MAKKALKIVDNEEIEEVEVADGEPIKERKADRFFELLPTDREIKISVYKKHPMKKNLQRCEDFWNSDRGLDYDEIRKKWGAGDYVFYAHERGENGKMEFVDSTAVSFAEEVAPSVDAKTNEPGAFSKAAFLEELRVMRELFGSQGGGDNSIMLALMNMQAASSKDMLAMMDKQSREMRELIISMNAHKEEKQNTISQLKELLEIRDMIGGDGGGEKSFLDQISPIVSPLLPSLIAGMGAGGAAASPGPALPAPAMPTQEQLIKTIVAKIPENIKAQITLENRDEKINTYARLNPSIDRGLIEKAVEQILLDRVKP